MPDLDLQQAIEDKVRQDFAGTGLDLSGFDFSALSTRLAGLTYNPRPIAVSPMFIDRSDPSNCGEASLLAPLSKSYVNTTSMTLTLSTGVNLGAIRGSSLTVGLPSGAPVSASAVANGQQTATLTIGASMSASITYVQNESISFTATVPPCSRLEIEFNASRVAFAGNVTVDLEVSGLVTFDVKKTGSYFGTGQVSYPIQQTFPLSGTYSGVTGTAITYNLVQYKAQCPPGSFCNPRTTTGGSGTGETGAGTGTGTGSGTGSAPKPKPAGEGGEGHAAGGGEAKPVIVLPPGTSAEAVGQCYANAACSGNVLATCTVGECVFEHDGRSWKGPDGVCRTIAR